MNNRVWPSSITLLAMYRSSYIMDSRHAWEVALTNHFHHMILAGCWHRISALSTVHSPCSSWTIGVACLSRLRLSWGNCANICLVVRDGSIADLGHFHGTRRSARLSLRIIVIRHLGSCPLYGVDNFWRRGASWMCCRYFKPTAIEYNGIFSYLIGSELSCVTERIGWMLSHEMYAMPRCHGGGTAIYKNVTPV